ncbi:general transcription factor 3C polypeptide 2 isoform X2 [Trichomycterus rosablanca]
MDFSHLKETLEANQEMFEGQIVNISQGLSKNKQDNLTPGNKKRKFKKNGYNDAEPKKEAKCKTLAKKRSKIVSEATQHDNHAMPETRPKRRAARVALEYLHQITKDLEFPDKAIRMEDESRPEQMSSPAVKKTSKGKGCKRKASNYNSDQNDDADFDPDDHEEVESEVDEDEAYEVSESCLPQKKRSGCKFKGPELNGFHNYTMQPVWTAFKNTQKFRDDHFSPWVFSEWIPAVSDWHRLSLSEAETYLPQEQESMTFTLCREGIKEKNALQRVKRFESLPPNTERWDSLFFAGGPVWAMEWCPCPEGAAHKQYAALYCNRNMDDRHKMNILYAEHALLQLWDLGRLPMNKPSSSPRLAYALAVDDGCIWNIKWCPSGAWELPTTERKAQHMPRLGLIATAFSNGTIAVYSLPHPEPLIAQQQATGDTVQDPMIYRVRRILTIKLGSNQEDHNGRSGQSFSIDWLPVKPHNILAAGFSDGMVALWDLSTKSPLQRVRSPDKGLSLYPYHCFIAHDNTIRSLSWCRASSELMVTVGDDRMAKLWNLTKTYSPLKAIKRFLPTEVSWPVFWPGIFLTQESCYTTLGQQGLHYLDSGYFGQKPLFVCTRKATVWSFSVSDWMNSCVIGDNIGDFVYSLLCDPKCNYSNTKRHRFPVYTTDIVPFGPGQSVPEFQVEEKNEEEQAGPQHEPQSYKRAVRKYYLRFQDMDLRSFSKYHQKPIVKQLHASETKGILFVDQMPLNALYKV